MKIGANPTEIIPDIYIRFCFYSPNGLGSPRSVSVQDAIGYIVHTAPGANIATQAFSCLETLSPRLVTLCLIFMV
jgi:hypothetical protein